MKTYTYSQARQQLATLLDLARREGRVQIRRQDGSVFVLESVTVEGSPLDVPGVRTTLRAGELARLLRAQRKASGDRLLSALSSKRSQPAKARRSARPRRAKNK